MAQLSSIQSGWLASAFAIVAALPFPSSAATSHPHATEALADAHLGARLVKTMARLAPASTSLNGGFWYRQRFDSAYHAHTGNFPDATPSFGENDRYWNPNATSRTLYLKPRTSAFDALHDYAAFSSRKKGICITDCTAIHTVAMHLVLARELGKPVFDRIFGDPSSETPENRRLRIGDNNTVQALSFFLEQAPLGTAHDGRVRLFQQPHPGIGVYFKGVPGYRKKHPAGAFRGFNTVYVGARRSDGQPLYWGFGMDAPRTRAEVIAGLVAGYNAPRTPLDWRQIEKLVADGTHAPSDFALAEHEQQFDPTAAQSRYPDVEIWMGTLLSAAKVEQARAASPGKIDGLFNSHFLMATFAKQMFDFVGGE